MKKPERMSYGYSERAVYKLDLDEYYKCLEQQHKEMFEALKGLIRIKDLMMPPPNIPAVHEDEAKAITTMVNSIQLIINEIEG